ncbi:hypothetical protein J6P92_05150 [bacterium]|nr:hypothetical protein [bacterium]
MAETTFNGNLCIGTSYEELSDKSKHSYKPDNWTFVDKFPENITEVEGNIAIFNQLPTFPKGLKIKGYVEFKNIEFKENDRLPFNKTVRDIDFYDCYGTLDLGGIDTDGNIFFGIGEKTRKLKVQISEPAKVNSIDFQTINLYCTLKNLTVNNSIDCRHLKGLEKIYPTAKAEQYFISDSEFSSDSEWEFNSVYEIYEAFPHLVPDDKELQSKYGFDVIKPEEVKGKISPIIFDKPKFDAEYVAVYSKDKKLLKIISQEDGAYDSFLNFLPDLDEWDMLDDN